MSKVPLCSLASCQVAFVACLAATWRWLPPDIASHFGPGGAPDGWTSRTTYAALMTCVALGSSSLMAGVFYSIRFFPAKSVNLPNRDFWLAPERRAASLDFLFSIGLWMAACETLFFAGVHLLVVFANRAAPPRLSPHLVPLAIAFLLAMICCIATIFWRFSRIQLPAESLRSTGG